MVRSILQVTNHHQKADINNPRKKVVGKEKEREREIRKEVEESD